VIIAADITLDHIALDGDWYDGKTGSSLSAAIGGCSVFSVGRDWILGVCISAETEWACSELIYLLELIMLEYIEDTARVSLRLSPKEEVLLYVPLTPMQRFWYTQLLTRVDDIILHGSI